MRFSSQRLQRSLAEALPANMDGLMNLYRDQPVKVEQKRVSLYKQKKLEEDSRQKVEGAVNQWLYNGLHSQR